MTTSYNSADASFYYYEDAAADIANMDSSAVYGNLADAMKNSVVVFPTVQCALQVAVLVRTDSEHRLDAEMRDYSR